MNLSEILFKFKKGLKFWNTTRQWNAPERAPQAGGQLFGVKGHPWLVGNCLVYVYQFLTSNSDFKTTSNVQNFLFP